MPAPAPLPITPELWERLRRFDPHCAISIMRTMPLKRWRERGARRTWQVSVHPEALRSTHQWVWTVGLMNGQAILAKGASLVSGFWSVEKMERIGPPQRFQIMPRLSYFPNRLFIGLPLWMLVVLIAPPTVWFWHLDRRRPLLPLWMPLIWLWRRDRRFTPPGVCRCGYNLTANKSGVCPECGTPTGLPPNATT